MFSVYTVVDCTVYTQTEMGNNYICGNIKKIKCESLSGSETVVVSCLGPITLTSLLHLSVSVVFFEGIALS